MADQGAVQAAESSLTVCTIIAKNYLAQARVLAESLAKHDPGVRFFVLLTDHVDGCFDPQAEPFTVVPIDALPIPDLPRFCFQYTILELNTAVKPYFLEYLFAQHAAQKLVYLDPDIMIFNSLQPIAELLDRHAIVLTPHLTEAVADGCNPSEIIILRSGAYNLGFLAVSNRPTVGRLLDWWKKRLYTDCRVDMAKGFFVDQRWMDLAPGYFDDVYILRDPGYNVAYWNLHSRTVSSRDGQVQVNGVPCRFFHFSGYDPAHPEKVSKHQNRFTMLDLGDTQELFTLYAQRLAVHGHAEISRWPYAFACFDNGESISDADRAAYLQLGERVADFGNPFATASPNSFHRWLRPPVATPEPRRPGWVRRMLFPLERQAKRAPQVLKPGAAPASVTADEVLPFGVNVAGYFESEKGVGEGCRAVVRALEAARIPYVLNNVVDSGSANLDQGQVRFADQNPYAINLVHVNADQAISFCKARGLDYFRGRCNIGFWNWELDQFPAAWDVAFRYFDEVWTPSSFSQRSIAAVAPIPVQCVPYAIDVPKELPSHITRADFGLPQDAFLFLYAFDFHSFFERKNPLGAIRAFQRAFGKQEKVGLVLKTVHGRDVTQTWRVMQSECAGWPNIYLLDRVLERTAMHALMDLCDAVVSLHRAEGFGLLLAEAMAMGKPALATAYSSNLDFMNAGNSLLVRYRELENDRDHGPYPRGAIWADPDVDHAAELMRHVVSDPESAGRLGARARDDIARELGPARIGALIRARLTILHERATRRPEHEGATTFPVLLRDLSALANLTTVSRRSSRPLLGRVVDALRRLAAWAVHPPMARQTAYNEVVREALVGFNDRLQRHERVLAELKRQLDAKSMPVPPPPVLRAEWGQDRLTA
jgi:glycosyltransferase involved in cell wall biosynthesis